MLFTGLVDATTNQKDREMEVSASYHNAPKYLFVDIYMGSHLPFQSGYRTVK